MIFRLRLWKTADHPWTVALELGPTCEIRAGGTTAAEALVKLTERLQSGDLPTCPLGCQDHAPLPFYPAR